MYYHEAQLAELAKRIDIDACQAFFDECAALKRRPHPLLRMRRENYPVYRVPFDASEIPWDKLTSAQQTKLRRWNLLDYDCIMEMLRRCPQALLDPSRRLEGLNREKTERGRLGLFQHMQRLLYKCEKGIAIATTWKTSFTHSHWALLRSTNLVRPMYCRTRLYWPDGEGIPRP